MTIASACVPGRVSVVLPVYNTAEFLHELYQRLKTTLEGEKCDFELLLVEDGGTDNSWEILVSCH